MQLGLVLASFLTWALCWLMFNFVSMRISRSFSAKLLSNCGMAPSMDWYLGLFLPSYRIWHFSFLNFRRFLSAHFSSLLRSSSMAAQLSNISTTSPSFMSSANLLRLRSAPLSRPLMKILNKTGPSTHPRDTELLLSN